MRHFIELTIGFHRAFVAAAGNDILLELTDLPTGSDALQKHLADNYVAG